MKEKNSRVITVKKKRVIYSLLIAVCVLLVAAATVLTVYFTTTGQNDVLEKPNIENPNNQDPTGDDNNPNKPDDKDPNKPDDKDPNKPDDNPSKPSTGDDVVKFAAPIANATCSVEYESIYTNVTMLGQIRKHMGVDYTAEKGTAVLAVADGVIASVSMDSVLGNVITIDHGDKIVSYYRFVEPIDGLEVGKSVKKGDKIAEVAEAYGTEKHAGEHLHFEMQKGDDWDNPAKYFDITYEEK